MRGGTIHKLIEKVEAYKEKVIGKEIEKNELKYKEAADNYNDTGYDRYYNKMQKLDEELNELKNYLKTEEKSELATDTMTADMYKEYKELKLAMKSLRSHFLYVKSDLNLPYTRDLECMEEILNDFGGE